MPPSPTVPLQLPGWCLRAWQGDDADDLSRHGNDVEVWRHMSDSFPHPYTLEIARHWVTHGHVDFGGDHWAIAHDGVAVGGCGVQQGTGGERASAEIGYWLGRAFWSRGVGTAVVRQLCDIAFATADIQRLFAPVHADNPKSMHVLRKNGFYREAELKRSAYKDGRVIDRVQWARLRGPVPAAPHEETLT